MNQNELYHFGIKGMRWGVRRYRNKDGSLTPEGEKRYERDKLDNAGKKKDARIDVSQPDPSRWHREDLERSKAALDSASNLVKFLKTLNDNQLKSKHYPKKRMDLSEMTDQELRERINRANLERQYRDLFAPNEPTVPRGREYLTGILDTVGSVLTVTGSAVSVALAIQKLSGK